MLRFIVETINDIEKHLHKVVLCPECRLVMAIMAGTKLKNRGKLTENCWLCKKNS
jgi:hypothetical protein